MMAVSAAALLERIFDPAYLAVERDASTAHDFIGFENLTERHHAEPASIVDPHARGAVSRGSLNQMRPGGGTGIRTPGTLARSLVFKTSAFNHSAIPPQRASVSGITTQNAIAVLNLISAVI